MRGFSLFYVQIFYMVNDRMLIKIDVSKYVVFIYLYRSYLSYFPRFKNKPHQDTSEITSLVSLGHRLLTVIYNCCFFVINMEISKQKASVLYCHGFLFLFVGNDNFNFL